LWSGPAGVEAVAEGRVAGFVQLTQHLGWCHRVGLLRIAESGIDLPQVLVVEAVFEWLLDVVLVAAVGRTAPSVSVGLDLANAGVAAVAADR
jgi:hypothetical protein